MRGETSGPWRFLIRCAIRVDDEKRAVRRPLRIAMPITITRELANPGRGNIPRLGGQVSNPNLHRAVAGVAFALIVADNGDSVLDFVRRARIAAIVGDEHEMLAVRRKRRAAIETIGDHTAIRLALSTEWNRGSAGCGHQPDVRGGIGIWRHWRESRRAVGKRPRGEKRDPFSVGRKHGISAVRFARLQCFAMFRAPGHTPERLPRGARFCIGPLPGINRGVHVRQHDEVRESVGAIEIVDGDRLEVRGTGERDSRRERKSRIPQTANR